jgi:hypothetical protein
MDKNQGILFGIGIVVSGLAAWLLTLTNIWQLVLLAGIIGGTINLKMGWGSLSAGIGVLLSWTGIMLYGLVGNNTTALLDGFAGVLGLTGWIFYLAIGLLGLIFGVLGGAIGGGVLALYMNNRENSD